MKIIFIIGILIISLGGCDSSQKSLRPGEGSNSGPRDTNHNQNNNTNNNFDNQPINTLTHENEPDPQTIEQARMRKELGEHQTKFTNEQALLKEDHDAYKWSEQHKRFFDFGVNSPMGRDHQDQLTAGSKPINDNISVLQNLLKNADFPKTNSEWAPVVGDRTHKYSKIYYDFLIDYKPGSTAWDYDNIIDLAQKNAQKIDAILNNPYTTKTTNYKTLKMEIENINKNKKDAFIKYEKYTKRLERIVDVLASSHIFKTDFEDLIKPL